MSKPALVVALYSDEHLTLHGDMRTELLIVHLGTPPGSVQLDGHVLAYDALELHGSGSFEVRGYGEHDIVRRFQQ